MKNTVNYDLTKILKQYENKWVVLSNDNSKVLAAGDSFDAIIKSLKDGVAMKVPSFTPFSPLAA